MLRSGHGLGFPIKPCASSSDRNWVSSMVPPLAMAAYILARPRAVTTPLAAGISPSRNGISPCTNDLMPGKNIAPNAPESGRPATFGATKLNTGLPRVLCGARICATFVGEPAGGRPRCRPSVSRGRATSSRISSRMPMPVTARVSPDSSHHRSARGRRASHADGRPTRRPTAPPSARGPAARPC